MTYLIQPCTRRPDLTADWNDAAWKSAETLEISHFRREGSDHRPQTKARVLYHGSGLHGIFLVRDRFVRCIRENYFDSVWKDSCVEFFVEPKSGGGYFNFEFNCGGAFLCGYITDPTRTPEGLKSFIKVPKEAVSEVRVKSTLPRIVEPELENPTDWTLQFFIPLGLLEKYTGSLELGPGKTWRGNFFKCAEEVSHPHWAAWAPVDELNFHLPRCFGTLVFGGNSTDQKPV